MTDNLELFEALPESTDSGGVRPFVTVLVHFEAESGRAAFQKLVGRPLTHGFIWFPNDPDAAFGDAFHPGGTGSSGRIVANQKVALFADDAELHRAWREWKGMPEFTLEDLQPYSTIEVRFRTEADLEAFERLLDQRVQRATKRTSAVWFPKTAVGSYSMKRYRAHGRSTTPRYPIFVPTKGRWESRFTIKTFEEIGVPYHAVVEAQEVRHYVAAGVPEDRILVLPHRDKGLVATRNWIWDRAHDEGHKRFWTFDDNIRGLFRFNRNLKTPVVDGAILCAIEDFADRYANLPVCGCNYFMFAVRKAVGTPPIYLNNRVYSNMLIETDYPDPSGRPYRNEGYYNDDTDLCLRMLKDGNCTVLFNAFLIYKMVTMTVKGGMTTHYVTQPEPDPHWMAMARRAAAEGWYAEPEDAIVDEARTFDGRWRMAAELAAKHPDVAKISHRFHRWQHVVDYSPWRRNELRLREGVDVPEGVDDYGMVLERRDAQTGIYLPQSSPWYPWEDGR